MQAVRVGTNARSQGDVGRIMVVLLTYGRANISLGRSNDDPEALTVKPSQAREPPPSSYIPTSLGFNSP